MRALLVGIVLLLGLSGDALADSDGYYCVGPGYLAYELRAGISTSGVSSHALRVIRFGEGGLLVAGEVSMEDFQTHRMVCEEKSVRIGGFSSRPVEYVIDVSSGAPSIVQVVTDPQRAMQRTALRNLGAWARSGAVPLSSSDPAHAYRLVTTETEERVGDELLHHRKTDLVMTDREGNVVQSLTLFDGHLVETID